MLNEENLLRCCYISCLLITSGFVVKIVDATVQIDDDIGLLATLLAAVNAIVGFLSYKLYKRAGKK